jgi:hypothetical protein
MHGIGIGAIVAALLLSGLFVGVSQGAPGPATIRLQFGKVLTEHGYPLRDSDGNRSGSISYYKIRLRDADGTEIGRNRSSCPSSADVGTWCTFTLVLDDGPYTDAGTITVTGLFKGFNGEESAVIGGTGAYRGASGYATSAVEDGRFIMTVELI